MARAPALLCRFREIVYFSCRLRQDGSRTEPDHRDALHTTSFLTADFFCRRRLRLWHCIIQQFFFGEAVANRK
jgi:hypothetical protein